MLLIFNIGMNKRMKKIEKEIKEWKAVHKFAVDNNYWEITEQLHDRIVSLKDALDVIKRACNYDGDYSEIKQVLNRVGVPFNLEKTLEFIEPDVWHGET